MFLPYDPDAWTKLAAELEAKRAAKKAAEKPRKPGATCRICAEYNEYAQSDEKGEHECWRCKNWPGQ